MNYTTEQVIELYNKYTESRFEDIDSMLRLKDGTLNQLATFEQWLLDKEKAELPVEGQTIWVADNQKWWKAEFFKFNYLSGTVKTTTGTNWDEYSLTDPNQ